MVKKYATTKKLHSESEKRHMVRQILVVHTHRHENNARGLDGRKQVQDNSGEEVMKPKIFDHPIILTIGLLAALKSLGIINLDFSRFRGE